MDVISGQVDGFTLPVSTYEGAKWTAEILWVKSWNLPTLKSKAPYT